MRTTVYSYLHSSTFLYISLCNSHIHSQKSHRHIVTVKQLLIDFWKLSNLKRLHASKYDLENQEKKDILKYKRSEDFFVIFHFEIFSALQKSCKNNMELLYALIPDSKWLKFIIALLPTPPPFSLSLSLCMCLAFLYIDTFGELVAGILPLCYSKSAGFKG